MSVCMVVMHAPRNRRHKVASDTLLHASLTFVALQEHCDNKMTNVQSNIRGASSGCRTRAKCNRVPSFDWLFIKPSRSTLLFARLHGNFNKILA